MQEQKKAVFSPGGEYFAFADCQGVLKIWDTASNTVKKHALNSINHTCSSLSWSPASELTKDQVPSVCPSEHQCLAVGTLSGHVLLYDLISDKFSNHFVPAQSDVVSDLCWYSNSLFSCSWDKSIAVWDTVSGELKSKWRADNEPLHSICIIDDENMLSASTSILWWNIKEQTVIKKFSGHSTEILTLLPAISTEKSCNSYFLSVAAGDSKVNAWLLHTKNSLHAVASFDLPDDLVSIDVTRHFSKQKPMYLSAVMKNGALLLFNHVLNGKTRSNLLPQSIVRVVSKPTTGGSSTATSNIPVLAAKICGQSLSCVIAYGESENPTFETLNISDCPKRMTLARDSKVICNDSKEIAQVKLYNKKGEFISVNGSLPSGSPLYGSPKRRRHKDPDDKNPETPNKHSNEQGDEKVKCQREVVQSDPENIADNLVKGLHTQDRALVNMVLLCSDDDIIRRSVELLPLTSLRPILVEMHNRLIDEEDRYIYSSRKWLKEIFSHHLQYIRKRKDLEDIIKKIKDFIDKQRVTDTLAKLTKLKGMLYLQRIQHRSVGYSDSEENME